jgi:CRP-like cAMP-binding protein
MLKLIQKIMQLGLDENQARELVSLFKDEVSLKRNDFWLSENTICQHLGFISAGMCRHFYYNDKGDEITRWVSLENEFITSIGSFIRQNKTTENIQALQPTKILVLNKEDWENFCKKNQNAYFFWARAIEEYLIGLEERIYSLIALNAKDRYELLRKTYPQIILNVPDKYLASILGIKPRHLSRLRAKYL